MTVAFQAVRSGNGTVISPTATTEALRRNMEKYCKLVVQTLRRDYEEIPEGPNYTRKYKGGSSPGGVGGHWRIQVSADGQSGYIYNDVPYARYVQGHQGQQSSINIEVGWHSIDDIVAATRPLFNKTMGDAISEGIAKPRRERNRLGQFV